MIVTELISQIDDLPMQEKIFLLERVVQSIKKTDGYHSLESAANELYDEYKNNKELTIFTSIDYLDFYETR